MSHRPIKNRHAWSSIFDGTPIKHVCSNYFIDETCWSLFMHVELLWGMLISYEACCSPMRYVDLQLGMLISDEACQSSIRNVGLRSGMSVTTQSCLSLIWNDGFQSGMSVSNGYLIKNFGRWWRMSVFNQACLSPMDHW